jgi:hypothetical protein
MKDDTAMRSTISFVAIGCFRYMQEALNNNPKKYEFLIDTYSGQIGVVDMVTQHAYLIEKAWKRKENKDIDYVWDYDVSEAFGYYATANLADDIQLNPVAMIESLIDELENSNGP